MKKKQPMFNLKYLPILFFVIFLSSQTMNAQGPNTPEAASFEPVDATDMVNLATGDLSYVLPLLNVSSPEGGYPIALAYHGGIAMDQEASWVGLGWNINPGTINRNVNVNADDSGWTRYNEFFYDAGFTENYYNFSVGASFFSSVSIGVGLSWGANQSLGGYVSAGVGLKGTPFQIGGHLGTSSVGINVGYGFNYNGRSYDNSVGIGINYNYDSGLSAGLSLSDRAKQSAIGINFSSKGSASINGSVAGNGIGNATPTQTIDSGDYTYVSSTDGFGLDTGLFNIGYQKNSVKITLFKLDDIYTSGILYPYAVLLNKDFSTEIKENYFMDVNTLQRFSENDSHNDLIDNSIGLDKNNLVVPSYDNYVLTAQGLSGTLIPYISRELNLSPRGREAANNDQKYISYVNDRNNGDTDKYFTFSNYYNSFLRLSKTDIFNNIPLSANGDNLLDAFQTNNNNIYSTIGLNVNNKKREGNVIKTFTNKEIRDSYTGYNGYLGISNIVGFINSRQNSVILNRQDTNVFSNLSIGAYQITSVDGKTYHYSLPVYQFESFYKNFRNAEYNAAGENENFFEIQKTTPYATHWLLTAITGPDYVDINNNGALDNDDYGYWVEFNYGKWSDGYIWKTPNGRNEEIIDKNDPSKKTYSYSWGRKQIYYLDAIKTRTHTALFVKEIRQDNKSVVGNERNVNLYSNKYEQLYPYAPVYLRSGNVPYQIGFTSGYPGFNTRARIGTIRNLNATGDNYLLKLKKIILVKNENIGNINLNARGYGLIQPRQLTFSYYKAYTDIRFDGPVAGESYGVAGNDGTRWGGTGVFDLYSRFPDPNPKTYDLHQQNNVLDVTDIEGLNLEQNALKVIEFNHDYSLAKDSPNGSPGKLTLGSLSFKGKGGQSLIPPYVFSYNNPLISFNNSDIDDWGFHKSIPEIWSLNNIKMPSGGNVRINYESDSYYAEASTYENKDFTNITISNTSSQVSVTFNDGTNINDYFKIGRDVNFSFPRKTRNALGIVTQTKTFATKLNVASINGNILWLNKINGTTEGLDTNFTIQCPANYSQGVFCYSALKISNNKYPTYTDVDLNGKKGGGIRTKNIIINTELGDLLKTEYLYTNSLTNKITGITSYAPSKIEKGIPYASELPSPMIMYGEVTMITKNGSDIPISKTIYEIETLSPQTFESGYIFSLGESFKVKENQSQTFQNNQVFANKYTIENRLGNLGRIKSIKNYNASDQLLSRKVNLYKSNLDLDGEIGVNQETFKSYKVVKTSNISKYYVNSTSKIVYPSVLQSSTTQQGSYTNNINFEKYDFLTGQILETSAISSDGRSLKTKIVPAYSKYPEMGSKVDNIDNKNMLSQNAANYSYILDKTNNLWKETGVSLTTWNNIWTYKDIGGDSALPLTNNEKIWRQHKNFIWKGAKDSNGFFIGYNAVGGTDDGFDWTVGATTQPVQWQQTSATTLYDHFSAPLEMKDINNNFVCTKMGDQDSKIILTGNARYNELFYAGGENFKNNYWLEPEVRLQNGVRSGTYYHTGKQSIATTSNTEFGVFMRGNEHRAGKYKLSVWIHKDNVAKARLRMNYNSSIINFSSESYTAGDWILKTAYLDIGIGDYYPFLNSVDGTTVYYDDLMIRPVASSIKGYVYNEWDELSYIIGNNGLGVKYEYDAGGRLFRTLAEVVDNPSTGLVGGFKKVSENKINYKNL